MTPHFILKYFIRKLAARQKTAQLKTLNEIDSLVLLSASNRETTQINREWLRKQFPQIKHVRLINFTNEKKVEKLTLLNVEMDEVNSRGFSPFGELRKGVEELFSNTSFDVLINTDNNSNLYLHLIALHIHANLKIGRRNDVSEKLYSILLSSDKETGFQKFVIETENYLNDLTGNK